MAEQKENLRRLETQSWYGQTSSPEQATSSLGVSFSICKMKITIKYILENKRPDLRLCDSQGFSKLWSYKMD